jgi:cytochrome c-type protein NapB
MRTGRIGLVLLAGAALLAVVAAKDEVEKSSAAVRASRRAYDGAPPVVPHGKLGADCRNCHTGVGIEVPGVGYSPPNPHGATAGLSDRARCEQCHVYAETDGVFRASGWAGMLQDLRAGRRWSGGSPPVIPHRVFMRENCAACHTGAAAREEIRTSHPERIRCVQCHVEQVVTTGFAR